MYYTEPQTLIVVYKDELLLNQVKKLIETKDDDGSEKIVGTKDGAVNIVSWSEKIWLEQKKAGNINNKVLFLGNIKGIDKLTPIIDVKFNEFGVKYGWAGRQAVVFAEPKAISKKDEYNKFLKILNELSIPDKVKKHAVNAMIPKTVGDGMVTSLKYSVPIVGKIMATKDILGYRKNKEQQMLFYGIMNLYANHLEEFMNS